MVSLCFVEKPFVDDEIRVDICQELNDLYHSIGGKNEDLELW